MSDIQRYIQTVRDALDKATTGPWSLSPVHWHKGCMRKDCKQSVVANGIGTVAVTFGAQYREFPNENPRTEINSPNAELIANSPAWLHQSINIISQQAEEIERLRQALDMIEIHNGTIDAFKEIEKILKGVHPHVNP